jgi:hypothetical protein
VLSYTLGRFFSKVQWFSITADNQVSSTREAKERQESHKHLGNAIPSVHQRYELDFITYGYTINKKITDYWSVIFFSPVSA